MKIKNFKEVELKGSKNILLLKMELIAIYQTK